MKTCLSLHFLCVFVLRPTVPAGRKCDSKLKSLKHQATRMNFKTLIRGFVNYLQTVAQTLGGVLYLPDFLHFEEFIE